MSTRDPVDFQFLRVSNRANEPIDLSGARIEEGVEFVFPRRTILPPNDSLLVVRNQRSFHTRYTTNEKVVGEFRGRLSREGERISLRAKDQNLIESIRYRSGGNWPVDRTATGVALVRRPDSENNDPDSPDSWALGSLNTMTKSREPSGD